MTQFRYLAFISLDGAVQGELPRQYPSGSHDLLIRCSRLDEPALRHFLRASIYRDDDEPLKQGDCDVLATVEVSDDDSCAFLDAGQRITLWNGHECGHGVISRRIFSRWA